MSISVFWDNDSKTILRWELFPDWSLEDFRAANEKSKALVAAVSWPFDVIVNANHHAPPPFPLGDFQRALREKSPYHYRTIVVNPEPFGRALLETLRTLRIANINPEHLRTARSVKEARLYCAEYADADKLPGQANSAARLEKVV